MKNVAVSEETIKKTTKCLKNFSCLSGCEICKVEECIGGKVIFIKCKDEQPCMYRIYFGYSRVCTCPVRIELYNRYKI